MGGKTVSYLCQAKTVNYLPEREGRVGGEGEKEGGEITVNEEGGIGDYNYAPFFITRRKCTGSLIYFFGLFLVNVVQFM